MSWFDTALHLAGFLPDGVTRALARITADGELLTQEPERPITPKHVRTAVMGNTLIVAPASGKAIRLWWHSVTAHADNSATVVAGLRFGPSGTDFWAQSLSKYGQGAAHGYKSGDAYYQGGVDQILYVNLDAAQLVYVNIDYEEVTP